MHAQEFPQDYVIFDRVVDKLAGTIENLLTHSSTASSKNDLVPDYVLIAIANVIEALMYNSSDPIEFPTDGGMSFTEQLVQMIDDYLTEVFLASQIPGEKPIFVDAGFYKAKGQRLQAKNILPKMDIDGTQAEAILPTYMLKHMGDEEIFQTMTSMISNPYPWRYESAPVTSEVLIVSFKYAQNKSEIEISDLDPEEGLVQLRIPVSEYNEILSSETQFEKATELYLGPDQSQQAILNISHMLTSGSAAQIEILASSEVNESVSVMAYIGYGYEPSGYRYNNSLNITDRQSPSNPSSHTNYTFFISNR